jgi:hypothetical protein
MWRRRCSANRTPRGYPQDASPRDYALPYTWVDIYEDGFWVAAHSKLITHKHMYLLLPQSTPPMSEFMASKQNRPVGGVSICILVDTKGHAKGVYRNLPKSTRNV